MGLDCSTWGTQAKQQLVCLESFLIHQALEERVLCVLVELDADLGPEFVGEVVQKTASGDGHEECGGLLFDSDFGDGDRVRNHLDRSTKVQRTDDDHATLGTALEK